MAPSDWSRAESLSPCVERFWNVFGADSENPHTCESSARFSTNFLGGNIFLRAGWIARDSTVKNGIPSIALLFTRSVTKNLWDLVLSQLTEGILIFELTWLTRKILANPRPRITSEARLVWVHPCLALLISLCVTYNAAF